MLEKGASFSNVSLKRSRKVWQPLEGAGTVKNVCPPSFFLKTEDTRTDKNAPFVPTPQSHQALQMPQGIR